MSQHILHIRAGTRLDNTSVIAGDWAALTCLLAALEDALRSGSGGTALSTSDGEPHLVAIVAEVHMDPVYTTYAGETAPARSRRETVSLEQLKHFPDALAKASAPLLGEVRADWTGQDANAYHARIHRP